MAPTSRPRLGIGGDEQPSRDAHLAPRDEPLLVAAGEIAGRHCEVRHGDVRRPRRWSSRERGRFAPAGRSGRARSEASRYSRSTALSVTLSDGARPLFSRSSGICADAEPGECCGALFRNRLAVDRGSSRRVTGREARQNFAQLALAVAGDAGDAEDLAGIEVEIDVVQAATPRSSRPTRRAATGSAPSTRGAAPRRAG